MNNLTENLLIEEYINNGKSTITISQEFGISKPTVLKKLRDYGITVRSNSRLGRKDVIARGSKKLEIDKEYGIVTTIEVVGRDCKCQCRCGSVVLLNSRDIVRGRATSCGCLRSQNYASCIF